MPAFDAARTQGPDDLALPRGVQIVVGGGDRACEVLGAGAQAGAPMVSWGTTANVSVPHPGPIGELPGVAAVSLGALGGFIVEAGLSAAGAALDWLARITGRPSEVLLTEAAASPTRRERCRRAPLAPRRPRSVVEARRARGIRRAHQCDRSG